MRRGRAVPTSGPGRSGRRARRRSPRRHPAWFVVARSGRDGRWPPGPRSRAVLVDRLWNHELSRSTGPGRCRLSVGFGVEPSIRRRALPLVMTCASGAWRDRFSRKESRIPPTGRRAGRDRSGDEPLRQRIGHAERLRREHPVEQHRLGLVEAQAPDGHKRRDGHVAGRVVAPVAPQPREGAIAVAPGLIRAAQVVVGQGRPLRTPFRAPAQFVAPEAQSTGRSSLDCHPEKPLRWIDKDPNGRASRMVVPRC
jgi:hypothetical protein